jgi:RNA polymerase sigma factor (sigma-70 family)
MRGCAIVNLVGPCPSHQAWRVRHDGSCRWGAKTSGSWWIWHAAVTVMPPRSYWNGTSYWRFASVGGRCPRARMSRRRCRRRCCGRSGACRGSPARGASAPGWLRSPSTSAATSCAAGGWSRSSPERVAMARQAMHQLEKEVLLLPRRQQEVFVMRFFAGLDLEGIATALGVDVGTVKTHLHRAVHRVRVAVEEARP